MISPDPIYYHLENCGVDSFKKLERSLIHTFWPDDGEDIEDEEVEEDENEEHDDVIETIYCNGNNEVVKFFNQKCVICLEKDSVNAFTQCGHQRICEQCYQAKSHNDILKSVVCRT